MRARTISLIGAERDGDAFGSPPSASFRLALDLEEGSSAVALVSVDLLRIGSDFLAFALVMPLAAAAADALDLVDDLDAKSEEEANFLMVQGFALALTLAFEEEVGAPASESLEKESPSSIVRSTMTDDCFEPAMVVD